MKRKMMGKKNKLKKKKNLILILAYEAIIRRNWTINNTLNR